MRWGLQAAAGSLGIDVREQIYSHPRGDTGRTGASRTRVATRAKVSCVERAPMTLRMVGTALRRCVLTLVTATRGAAAAGAHVRAAIVIFWVMVTCQMPLGTGSPDAAEAGEHRPHHAQGIYTQT